MTSALEPAHVFVLLVFHFFCSIWNWIRGRLYDLESDSLKTPPQNVVSSNPNSTNALPPCPNFSSDGRTRTLIILTLGHLLLLQYSLCSFQIPFSQVFKLQVIVQNKIMQNILSRQGKADLWLFMHFRLIKQVNGTQTCVFGKEER